MWMDVFRAAAAEGRSLIFTFHPGASVAPDFPGRVVTLVEAAGGHVDFVALTCAPEAVAARVEAPSRRASGKLSSLDLLRELDAQGAFAYPPLPAPIATRHVRRTQGRDRECLELAICAAAH